MAWASAGRPSKTELHRLGKRQRQLRRERLQGTLRGADGDLLRFSEAYDDAEKLLAGRAHLCHRHRNDLAVTTRQRPSRNCARLCRRRRHVSFSDEDPKTRGCARNGLKLVEGGA